MCIKGRVIQWPVKLYLNVLTFFFKIEKLIFTFSRTLRKTSEILEKVEFCTSAAIISASSGSHIVLSQHRLNLHVVNLLYKLRMCVYRRVQSEHVGTAARLVTVRVDCTRHTCTTGAVLAVVQGVRTCVCTCLATVQCCLSNH